MTRADVTAIAAGTAEGAQRVKDICDRFGKDTYLEACDALLARTRTSIINLIRQLIPEGERFEFEDYTDDDGLGNGPITHRRGLHRQSSRAPDAAGRNPVGRDRPRISPEETEPVLNKLFASGFFGTGLSSLLTAAGTDTLIITGASTSGCVRATAVDALQHGFRPVVPREAVGDRNPDAHEANLYDIDAKYGDVAPVRDVLDYLEEIPAAHAH